MLMGSGFCGGAHRGVFSFVWCENKVSRVCVTSFNSRKRKTLNMQCPLSPLTWQNVGSSKAPVVRISYLQQWKLIAFV